MKTRGTPLGKKIREKVMKKFQNQGGGGLVLVFGLLDNDWHLLIYWPLTSHIYYLLSLVQFLTSPLNLLMNTLHAIKCVDLKYLVQLFDFINS